MKIKKKYKYVFLFFSIMFILTNMIGCSKEVAYVVISDDLSDDSLKIDINSQYKITHFLCSLENYKTYSFKGDNYDIPQLYVPISKDIYVDIFVYPKDKEPYSGSWGYFSVYQSLKTGMLYPLYNYIRLKPDNYTFYAITANSPNKDLTPDIDPSTGCSRYLYNNEPYYWWKNTEDIISDTTNIFIDIILKPICAQLEFQITGETEWIVQKINLIATNPQQSTFSLGSGMIMPIESIGDVVEASISNSKAQFVILPLVSHTPLDLYIYLQKDNENKILAKKVTQPKGNLFQGGYQYNYILDLKNDTILPQ